jgi:hypothetical protein
VELIRQSAEITDRYGRFWRCDKGSSLEFGSHLEIQGSVTHFETGRTPSMVRKALKDVVGQDRVASMYMAVSFGHFRLDSLEIKCARNARLAQQYLANGLNGCGRWDRSGAKQGIWD